MEPSRIIARREFSPIEGGRTPAVEVLAPVQDAETGDWMCAITFARLESNERTERVWGVDSLQALLLALKRMADIARRRKLRWLDNDHPGTHEICSHD